MKTNQKTMQTKTTKTSRGFVVSKLIADMPSEVYHSIVGTHSSSQLKDMLEDEEIFYRKYVEKSIEREVVDAFDVGTVFHTGTLEPHKLKAETIVYPGKVRRGADWERFKKKHEGKCIVTEKQNEQAGKLVKLVKDSPVAMGYIKRGKPEISLFLNIAIYRGDIYATDHGLVLTGDGWIKSIVSKDVLKKGVQLVIKVRADCLGDDFVLDLKSTTGNAKNEKSMRDKISYYNYDLSASLYADIFAAATGRKFHFVWTFASKDCHNCRSYRASEKNILVGRAKYKKALLKLADSIKSNWEFPDVLGILEPNTYELEHIKESDTDHI